MTWGDTLRWTSKIWLCSLPRDWSYDNPLLYSMVSYLQIVQQLAAIPGFNLSSWSPCDSFTLLHAWGFSGVRYETKCHTQIILPGQASKVMPPTISKQIDKWPPWSTLRGYPAITYLTDHDLLFKQHGKFCQQSMCLNLLVSFKSHAWISYLYNEIWTCTGAILKCEFTSQDNYYNIYSCKPM